MKIQICKAAIWLGLILACVFTYAKNPPIPPKASERTARAVPPSKPHTEPLSDAEIEAMAQDAPALLQSISNNHLVVANGTFITKSVMDVVGPYILEVLDRIDRAQSQLPKETEVRQNTTEVRVRFMRDWKECNATHEKAIPTVAVKSLMDRFLNQDLRAAFRTMSVEEQIKMRNLFTHARDKVLEVQNAPFVEKYIESMDASVANIFKTASDLMSSLKEIRFQVMVHRARKAAKVRAKELWREAELEHERKLMAKQFEVPIGEYRA